MKIIERKFYTNKIQELINTPDIKVITGIRRSGKSKFIEQLAKQISETNKSANIIHINFNLTDFEDLLDYHKLEDYIESKHKENADNYVMIDEIQNCPNFERAINSLHAKEKYDIYITGSNAFLQSSDLATLFVGRTYEFHIFPFSYGEYLKYFERKNTYPEVDNYIKRGGMSGSYVYKNLDTAYKYLNNDVLNALIVRDILDKYKFKDANLLNKIIDYLMDNISNLTSIRAIERYLNSNNYKVDHKTIASYIEALCKAFAFYKIPRYDIKGKKLLNTQEKYYLPCVSFRYARLGNKSTDAGRILENIVCIDLLRRGYEVYVGTLAKSEIDFVAIKNGQKTYIQVCNNLNDDKTFEREVTPLLSINDAYPKVIVARTWQEEQQNEGVRILDASEWLGRD